MRILQYFQLLLPLGPKLVMIKQMVRTFLWSLFEHWTINIFFLKIIDFASFGLIFLVFILAFGFSIESMLISSDENQSSLINLINFVYWPIYGEIRILDQLDKCFENPVNCSNLRESYAVLVLMIIYMVIASVMLLNLVIAMFRYMICSSSRTLPSASFFFSFLLVQHMKK